MADLQAHLHPYCLEAALAADRADSDCLVLDVGRDANGGTTASLKRVTKAVDDYLIYVHDLPVPMTKLYIVGDWILARSDTSSAETEDQEVRKNGERTTAPSAPSSPIKPNETPKWTAEEEEWHRAAEQITKFIAQMPALKELTWISGLPFVTCILEKLPPSMTKIILDLGQGIRLHQGGAYSHKAYITPADMKLLPKMTELRELRLLCMHDSLQPIVWETVFRSKVEGGMRVLDLQMAAAPICRVGHWRKAQDVVGLTAINEDNKEKEYKGTEGKGILHYSFGTGEYLDDFCMRKARIASGSDEAKPLPLLCLKLDGFVIDHLPFELELSQIVLLTCGPNCVDAGMLAPKKVSSNTWNPTAHNTTPVCLVQWPKWTGIFDDQDDQNDLRDEVFAEETKLPAASAEHATSSPRALTDKALCIKDLKDSLDGIRDDKSFNLPMLPSAAKMSFGAMSNASTRGSDVPTPTIASSPHEPEPIPDLDGSPASYSASSIGPSLVLIKSSDTGSLTDASLTLVNSTDTWGSATSTDGSFQEVHPGDVDSASTAATDGSKDTIMTDHETPKAAGLTHKVRRSWGWLGGSSS